MNDTISSFDNLKSAPMEMLQSQCIVKKRLLLHCCCAPCASHVIDCLLPAYDITLFFYNPNIEPYEEYIKRRDELEKLAVIYSLQYNTRLDIIDFSYDNKNFKDLTNSYKDEPEGGTRCKLCFDLRLHETARQAKELSFEIFATTLSVSPYKNAAILNDSGIRQSAEHNVLYLQADFKKNNGYTKSVELSKKYELYRQNYCGCTYSI